MNTSAWFHDLLKTSSEGFTWALQQLPAEHRALAPPRHPDAWIATRIAYHMLQYEQYLALPNMYLWLDEPSPYPARPKGAGEEWSDEMWEQQGSKMELDEIIARFRTIRFTQLELLPRFSEAAWDETRPALWGDVTLRW